MMKGRTARRLALARYLRWLARNHPDTVAPPCLIRGHNRWVRQQNRRFGIALHSEMDRFGDEHPWCPHPECHDRLHGDLRHTDEHGQPFTGAYPTDPYEWTDPALRGGQPCRD